MGITVYPTSPGGTGNVGGGSNLTTVGAIPYVSASGVLNQDASYLFWDATNNRLAVGNNSPSSTLHVYDATVSTGVTTLTVQAGAGQSSTDLQQWKNNAGTVLANVTSAGNLGLGENQQLRFLGSSDQNYTFGTVSSGIGSTYTTRITSFGDTGSARYISLASRTNVGVVTDRVVLNTDTGVLATGGPINFSSTANAGTGTLDTSLSRISAGIVGVGTGAAGSVAGQIRATSITSVALTVATLPGSPVAGQRAFVTDSNAASYTAGIGAVVAAGGTTAVPVVYDGTNWRIG